MTRIEAHDPYAVPDDLIGEMYDVCRRAELVGREQAPFWGPAEFSGAVRTRRSDEARDLLLAYDDQRPGGARLVGVGVMFRDLTANRDKAFLSVDVDPIARRRGVGRALLEALETRAADDGRHVLTARVVAPVADPEGHGDVAFARACGYDVAQLELTRHLALPVADDRLAGWLAQADPAGAGYELVTLIDEVPADLRASLGRLHAQLFVDAPSGGIDYEEAPVDEGLVEERLAVVRAMGRTVYETVALAEGRQVVAQSTIAVPTDPDAQGDAYQWGTFVDRAHRGHRLGLAVKAANLRAVQRDRPRLTRVITQNAETNAWMVAINEQLGFVPVESVVDLVKRVRRG